MRRQHGLGFRKTVGSVAHCLGHQNLGTIRQIIVLGETYVRRIDLLRLLHAI